MQTREVIVIGAGLAGLRAATRLAQSGRDVVVLEAGDDVGGRIRTDAVDGFLLDRGFQVLNPAYPALGRWVDVQALRLQRFPVGVRVRRDDGVATLAHPLRHPTTIAATLRSGLLRPADVLAFARWAVGGILDPRGTLAGPDRPLSEGWDDAGFRGPLRSAVVEPFLAGVLAEEGGRSSETFAKLLVRMFALGRPGLPERGMTALPRQLASSARAMGAEVLCGRRVARVRTTAHGVELDVAGDETLRATQVVVAVGAEALPDLLEVPAPPTRGLQTWWFATDEAPTSSAMIAVDGRRAGPLVNTVVISHAAPSYAPSGRHLIAATNLFARDTEGADEADVRRHLAAIWGTDVAAWALLRRDDIRDALPTQLPPLRATSAPRVADRMWMAGDHRDTASIQGALVSGDRVARALLAA